MLRTGAGRLEEAWMAGLVAPKRRSAGNRAGHGRVRWLIAVLGAGAVISIASPAAAHPLGNFTTNQHLGIEVVGD
jgi:hypothetical protein